MCVGICVLEGEEASSYYCRQKKACFGNRRVFSHSHRLLTIGIASLLFDYTEKSKKNCTGHKMRVPFFSMMFVRNIIPAYKYSTRFAPAECKTWTYADVQAVVVKIVRSNVKLQLLEIHCVKFYKTICSVSADKDGRSGTQQVVYSKANMKKKLHFDHRSYLGYVFRMILRINSDFLPKQH
jgi:hypothetical protein